MDELDVRLVTGSERSQVFRLFRKVFGEDRSPSEWRWRYDDNPHGAPLMMGAFDGGGGLVGFVGAYPVRFLDARSGRPSRLTVVHAGDAMTDPDRDVRMAGGGSPWLRAMRAVFRSAEERGHQAVFGVMVPRLQRIYGRYVGTRHLLQVTSWRSSVGALELDRGGDYDVERLRRPADVPPELDRLLEESASSYGLMVDRDAEYVRWRHVSRPGEGTRVWIARRGPELVAWAAFRRDGRRLMWGDGLVAPGHEGAVGALLSGELRSRWWRRPTEVEAWFPPFPDRFAEGLRAIGLEPGPQEDDLGVTFWGCDDGAETACGSLFYSRADCDLF